MGDVNITINQGAEKPAPDRLGALPPEQPTDGPPLLDFNPLSQHDWDHFFDSLGDKIKGQMNDLAKQILSGITSAGKTAISGVTKAGNSAVHGVETAGEKAYKTNADALQLVSKQFEDEVESAGKKALAGVKGAVAEY